MLEANRLGELTQQLKDVVRGYHPITKERFAETSDLKDPAIVDLHVFLLAELIKMPAGVSHVEFEKIMTRRANERDGKPVNHGTKWKATDVRDLCHSFSQGTDVALLADRYGRTIGSVIGKLRESDIITEDEGHFLYRTYRNRTALTSNDETE